MQNTDTELPQVIPTSRGPVTVLTLSSPGRKNAISTQMRTELLEQVTALHADTSVRAIVLTGADGDFSAGGDITEMTSDQKVASDRLQILHDAVRLLISGPKPVIAAVEGAAFGAGLSLAAACDVVVAGEGARFGAAFGKVGFVADCGLLWTLPMRVRPGVARDILFSARSIQTDEALALGIVDEVVPQGGAVDAAVARAERYAAVAPLAIAETKALLGAAPQSLDDLLEAEKAAQLRLALTEDHAEARKAFLEKRQPDFKGR